MKSDEIKEMTKIIIQYADWIDDTDLRRLIDMAAVNINRILAEKPLYNIAEQEKRMRAD